MDIGKVTGQRGAEVGLVGNNRERVVTDGNSAKNSQDVDAATTNVMADFEAEQRAKVERIGSAVRDGTYRQPESRALASAFIGGINELSEIVGTQS